MSTQNVYFFGDGVADGNESMKELLGGKGANLAEMAGNLKLPVPPGFTITTEVCTYYYKNGKKYPDSLEADVKSSLARIEKIMGREFGNPDKPLLFSVRSGARKSMPGMMETVLNVGLTSKTIPGAIKLFGNEWFVYDSYRRLIMMYSDVVMEKAAGIEPEEDEGIRKQLEKIMAAKKKEKGVTLDTELTVEDLKDMTAKFKVKVKEVLGKEFPDDPYEQLWGGIGAVFSSWNGKRAISYRKIERIPDEWGTAVNVQTMVFGNLDDNSATGVAFTRNPSTGEKGFYGEYLIKAQGEDVVSGSRTPAPVNEYSKKNQGSSLTSLEELMPEIYKELDDIAFRLEDHYHDMQDIEFTIENGKLWMLQCRNGKRNGVAAVKTSLDMVKEKLIDEKEAIRRVGPSQLDELLHPILDPAAEKTTKVVASGIPASPGGATGQVVFSAPDAVVMFKSGKNAILVREETNPEDIEGMRAAQGILTARGGRTSHAALVARGWGKCCIVGCADIHIDFAKKEAKIGDLTVKEGDFLSLNGTSGNVYAGEVAMMRSTETEAMLLEFLQMCNKVRKLKVRANADTPADAKQALLYGAEGIGLFRMEHMFYGKGSEEALTHLRKMIIAKSETERHAAIKELSPFVKNDIKKTIEVMSGHPVTIRLFDPPLHEFIPREAEAQAELIKITGITKAELENRAKELHEVNPMMGHRGVRLGISYPEITEMQFRSMLEAAGEISAESGKKVEIEIMVPVVATVKEVENQKQILDKVVAEMEKKFGKDMPIWKFGTMIEIPRAALTADKIAEVADFFSFGTNDLTQMTFGFSREDTGSFLPRYLDEKILAADPFETIDQEGVGELIKIGVEKGRSTKKDLKVGICGEHGGEPESVRFCHKQGFNYVSCSPYRIPIAILSAAQAALE